MNNFDQHVTHVNTSGISDRTCDFKLTPISNTCKEELNFSEKEYETYNQLLKDWDVQYRGYILRHYPRNMIKEAIARTYYKQDKLERQGRVLRIPGAYFVKILKNMGGKKTS